MQSKAGLKGFPDGHNISPNFIIKLKMAKMTSKYIKKNLWKDIHQLLAPLVLGGRVFWFMGCVFFW